MKTILFCGTEWYELAVIYKKSFLVAKDILFEDSFGQDNSYIGSRVEEQIRNKVTKAFENAGVDMDFYVRERDYSDLFPWDFVDIGVTKDFLKKENEKAKEAATTPNCREKCSFCGANTLCKGGKCSVQI